MSRAKTNCNCYSLRADHKERCIALTEMMCVTRGKCKFYRERVK